MPGAELIVLGAGPAGLAASLRLLALGHAVTIVERRAFPRAQIGEALTAGVFDILRYLDAEHVLEAIPCRAGLGTLRRWERDEPEHMSQAQRGPGIVVERASFDGALLQLARERGATVLQPARARARAQAQAQAQAQGGSLVIDGQPFAASVVIDARGRAAPGRRAATGAATFALWLDDPRASGERTTIEAVPLGWLWGTPLPTGGARTLAFVDPALARAGVEAAFAAITSQARLFEAPRPAALATVRCCDATARINLAPSTCAWIRTGEAAFCLDPLSSSGVERALRGGLQAGLAAHSHLVGGEPELIEAFMHARVIESVANHMRWSQAHYASAHVDGPFWDQRRAPWRPEHDTDDPTLRALADQLARPSIPPGPPTPPRPAPLSAQVPSLAPELSRVFVPCVIDDRIQAHLAVLHPRLDRPLAFVGGHAIVELLDEVPEAGDARALVDRWARRMPRPDAARLAGWMVSRGLITMAPL